MNEILVIVPCGVKKIWDRNPNAGPTQAYSAYIGPPFKLNRAYAERFADRWVVLSAKYGLIRPNFVIPETYDISFKKKSSDSVDVPTLRRQIDELRLSQYPVVVGLGGKDYRDILVDAFAETDCRMAFPFVGLPIGKTMNVIKHAISIGESGIPRPSQRRPILP